MRLDRKLWGDAGGWRGTNEALFAGREVPGEEVIEGEWAFVPGEFVGLRYVLVIHDKMYRGVFSYFSQV